MPKGARDHDVGEVAIGGVHDAELVGDDGNQMRKRDDEREQDAHGEAFNGSRREKNGERGREKKKVLRGVEMKIQRETDEHAKG